MQEQMEMILREGGIRDDGLNVDPVSGNEIPSGSLAEEVRDDIPAQLSGGEYVVPADVVRFFGVKYFEDLRMQAKLGLQDMEKNGRIGGEPVEPQQQMAQNTNQGITEADLQALEAMMTTGAYEGGLMDKIAYTVKNDPLVNERVNKKGTSVGFAEGGQVSSMFSDPNEIDSIIDQVSIMAQQNPAIAKELNQRGITVGQMPQQANVQQMQPRNTPAQVTNPVSQQMANGGTPDPFARFRVPGLSSSSGMGMPEPITPDITATPTPVVTNPVTAPAVATPDVGQCGEGRMWNGYECVLVRRTGDDSATGGGSTGGESGGDFGKSWLDGGGFTGFENLNNFIDEQLEGVDPNPGGDPSKNPFSNFVAGMPVMRVLNSFEALTNISKTRAAAQLNFDAELISKEQYEAALAKIDDKIPSGLRKAADAGLATGFGRTKGGKNKALAGGFDDNEDGIVDANELANYLKSLGKEETVVEPESTSTGGTEGPVAPAAPVATPNNTNGGSDNGSGGSFGDTITGSGRTQSEIDAGAGGGGYNSSPTGRVSTSKPTSRSTVTERSDDYATGDPGMSGSSSRRGGGGGKAKGGLMKKRKKK